MDTRSVRQKIWEMGNPNDCTRDEYITRVYNVLLRRDPDDDGLRRYRESSDLSVMLAEILQSPEFQSCSLTRAFFAGRRDTKRRILLFGAYGNGNLGDAIQAASLERLIRKVNPNIEVWASSEMMGTYPFSYDCVMPPGAVCDPNIVNQFDLLLIGGGGLFAHPHPPLNNIDWQRDLTLPIAILGVGADESIVAESENIIRKAICVSGRDESSIRALSTLRHDIRFCPDPVIADSKYFVNRDGRQQPNAAKKGILWIVKPRPEFELTGWLSLVDKKLDCVCFFEPNREYSLLSSYPNAQAIYSASDLLPLIDQSRGVFSMRYHGCILAMLRGLPVIGIREDKSRQLLNRYGNSDFFAPEFTSAMLPDFARYASASEMLIKDQNAVLEEMTHAIRGL